MPEKRRAFSLQNVVQLLVEVSKKERREGKREARERITDGKLSNKRLRKKEDCKKTKIKIKRVQRAVEQWTRMERKQDKRRDTEIERKINLAALWFNSMKISFSV